MLLLLAAGHAWADMSPAPRLACTLAVPARVAAGQPVPLQLTLHNPGQQAVQLLRWGTPFEGAWFAAFVTLRRGDEMLKFSGPKMKRGEPEAQDYLRLAPGQRLQASLDLGLVFDLSPPGHYTVQPQLQLHDVLWDGGGTVPRPRALHQGQPLSCPPVRFERTP